MDPTTGAGAGEAAKHLGPILAGTAVSMLFVRGNWKKKLIQGGVGVPFAMYIAPMVDRAFDRLGWIDITASEAGVIAAVFGLTVVAYVHEVMQQLQLGQLLREWMKRKIGG